MKAWQLRALAPGLLILSLLIGCGNAADEGPVTSNSAAPRPEAFTVYKQPTCGCCVEWMSHVNAAGMETIGKDLEDLNAVKMQYQIAPRYQSCHTAVSSHGYVFEGHVPARHIKAFLANPPADAIGLAVPGMPLGSPGMEVGSRFDPYEVLLLKKDGSSEVFARVDSPAQQ